MKCSWEWLLKWPRRPLSITRQTALLGGCLALSAIVLFVWQSREPERPETTFRPEVEIAAVRRASVVHTIRSPGTLTYREKASVSSRIQGRLQSLHAEQGQTVRRGQVLAQLERLEMDLQRNQALASLRASEAQHALSASQLGQARREVERRLRQIEASQAGIVDARSRFVNARQNLLGKVDLYRMGGISRKELRTLHSDFLSELGRYYQARKGHATQMVGFRDADLAEGGHSIPAATADRQTAFVDFNTEVEQGSVHVSRENVGRARAELRNIERLLAETTIHSPMQGVVASRSIEIGEEVKPGEPIFTIVRMDELLVSTMIQESDVPHIRPGQMVHFTVDAFREETFSGKVHLISPVIDLASRTTEVRVSVRNPHGRLAPGMFARCTIETGQRKSALIVPNQAILPGATETRPSVWVIREGRAFRQPVESGELFPEGREILSGLSEGDAVGTSSLQLLKEGTPVLARSADQQESRP